VTGWRALRINVTGASALEVQLNGDTLAGVQPPARAEHAALIAATPADKRLGRRRYEVVIAVGGSKRR
jgi:hypothetical protein